MNNPTGVKKSKKMEGWEKKPGIATMSFAGKTWFEEDSAKIFYLKELADARRELLTKIHDRFCELAIEGKDDDQELKGIYLYDRTLNLLAILRKET